MKTWCVQAIFHFQFGEHHFQWMELRPVLRPAKTANSLDQRLGEINGEIEQETYPYLLHGVGILIYICPKNQPNVLQIYMEHMGWWYWSSKCGDLGNSSPTATLLVSSVLTWRIPKSLGKRESHLQKYPPCTPGPVVTRLFTNQLILVAPLSPRLGHWSQDMVPLVPQAKQDVVYRVTTYA